jgi:hypothetical protein
MPNSLTFFSPASVLDSNGQMYFIITEALSADSSIVMLLVMDWKSGRRWPKATPSLQNGTYRPGKPLFD